MMVSLIYFALLVAAIYGFLWCFNRFACTQTNVEAAWNATEDTLHRVNCDFKSRDRLNLTRTIK